MILEVEQHNNCWKCLQALPRKTLNHFTQNRFEFQLYDVWFVDWKKRDEICWKVVKRPKYFFYRTVFLETWAFGACLSISKEPFILLLSDVLLERNKKGLTYYMWNPIWNLAQWKTTNRPTGEDGENGQVKKYLNLFSIFFFY